MVLAKDAVAEIDRDAHEAELKTMTRLFADVMTADDIIERLHQR
jgi:isochorismate hydrolase